MIDVVHEIDAVHRAVGAQTVDAGEQRTVTLTRTYDASVEDVWDACTNPERIPRWFLPVSGELRVGGRYQLEGNAGGTVTACEAPHRFEATWEFDGNVTWIAVELTAVEGDEERTRFSLAHTAIVNDHWEQYGPGAVGVGWDLGLMGLFKHLESPDAPLPKEGELLTSPEGRILAATLSGGWREADIAFGTDAGAARAAAERTRAFYTGTEPDTGG
jgi:uncharacterized protein YndB with AHSA1/START domain